MISLIFEWLTINLTHSNIDSDVMFDFVIE